MYDSPISAGRSGGEGFQVAQEPWEKEKNAGTKG